MLSIQNLKIRHTGRDGRNWRREWNAYNILLKFNGTQRQQEKFWSDKWLHINEETKHKKIASYTKITEMKNGGNFLYKLNAKGKNDAKFRDEGGSFINRTAFCIE